ncbi:PAS domain-containing sensor histidine kinase [Alisedimentitalea sp. MJ-SS2]|uniref:sensor histidine kinase NtrY-like n=1 Tax=Aliisedimentitalea sp. MJ-SS2 TaxID=3049795 RepID=UPI00290F4E04|nr:PAS domain-containing sensor histidine kinase [Alisedimentitalea sp. MJ-SS2]MDU8929685.1 PAS domain-containing sensor histidine kinase [Alisedimentitalea sp. MJ-SS2]
MTSRAQSSWWNRFVRLRRERRAQNIANFGLVVLAPFLVLATSLALWNVQQGNSSTTLRIVMLADMVYVVIVAALVMSRVARMIVDRRSQSTGSRLHLRLTGVFAIMALIPTVIVAIFAVLMINIGLEGWFSDRVRQVVGSSYSAAQAYEREHRETLEGNARAITSAIDLERVARPFMLDPEIRDALTIGQRLFQPAMREAYVIDGTGELRVRGESSYLFDFEKPTTEQISEARKNGIAIIQDWTNDEFRAIVPLENFPDRLVYVSRTVDGGILNLLDETQENVRLYNQLESERGRSLFEFGLLYLGFAVILILAAIWLGLWFAERLARPVGRLAGAAQQVGAGDLDVQVIEEEGDDEIAMLGRYFNQMTRQLKGQRDTLLSNTEQIERRRRQFDSVLTSVTSGVVGVDPEGRVTFVNRSAERLLDWQEDQAQVALHVAVPEFGPLFEKLRNGSGRVVQEEVKVSRGGRLENLLVRMSTRAGEEGELEGYVVAFDDVTDLVSAQRMAAWGDVARRIAHEIKNPLTPIQLSAERIKRKFTRELEDENADKLGELTDVIVRQTGDLRRIVDEFSKFARMPEPDRRRECLSTLVRDAVLLQEAGQPDVTINANLIEDTLEGEFDATMISQALTNLIKNAGEATETWREANEGAEGYLPQIRVQTTRDENEAVITIADNGIGLPEDRARLFEPYVTTRDKGTGLGLPIVKKIIEEHGGNLALEDAPAFSEGTHHGAMAVIRLPVSPETSSEDNLKTKAV